MTGRIAEEENIGETRENGRRNGRRRLGERTPIDDLDGAVSRCGELGQTTSQISYLAFNGFIVGRTVNEGRTDR